MATKDKIVNLEDLKVLSDHVEGEVTDLKSDLRALKDVVAVDFDYSTISTDNLNISSSNKWNSNNNYKAYYFSIPTGAKTLTVKGNTTNGSSIALLAATDTHTHGNSPIYATGWAKTFVNIGEEKTYNIPSDAKYAWFLRTSYDNNYEPSFYGFNVDLDGVQTDVNSLKTWRDYVEDCLPSKTELLSLKDLLIGKYIDSAVGSNWQNGYVTNSGSLYTASAIDVSKYDRIAVVIKSTDSHTGIRESGFCGSDNIVTSTIVEKDMAYSIDGSYAEAIISVTDKYFFFSASSKSYLKIYGLMNGTLLADDIAFVSTTGNDNGKGTYADPFATINAALKSGVSKIAVLGGKYFQRIDLSLGEKRTIEIVNYSPTKKVTLYSPDCIIAEAEESVDGYTNVHKVTTSKSFSANNVWIFQDGIADANTTITTEQRMPEQRGLAYRCLDTRISKCSADNLSDALNEIETATTYKWYLDGTTLYFSRPSKVTDTNPLCGSFNTNLFSNAHRSYTLIMAGIDVKYMTFNVNFTSNSVLSDCYCANVYGNGCFTFGQAVGAKFIRCEASRAYSGTNGDGFNAHSSNVDDTFAKQTTATLIDCWSHDNNDDGISLHERSEFTVIGGLYEQNYHGGGVTPANGSHCTCLGVYARKNGEGGFLYMNPTSASEGGVGGQIKCIDCVSEANNIWATVASAGYKINSEGNKGILINCKAIGEDYGYYVSDNDGALTLIDCGALNCTTVKGGKTGNITVQNTTIVN